MEKTIHFKRFYVDTVLMNRQNCFLFREFLKLMIFFEHLIFEQMTSHLNTTADVNIRDSVELISLHHQRSDQIN
jgi:hypothetical protein